jgi:hypothetical protein
VADVAGPSSQQTSNVVVAAGGVTASTVIAGTEPIFDELDSSQQRSYEPASRVAVMSEENEAM